ncbi:pre-peptidase C-terminal domain-containing protein [Luteolibacter yonseiensis]|uniref:Pre-peptidase C-terminal domain-containing protein n=1 Tax=Luteolibacter yonseiensis TaxID=1144680 RepID=A0A934VD51_9BACT|nr:pre-peptidase C-terminal domain-containing protein [Luteolibacter yonseiensis]MBK1817671.1 pre-peptidase C-terminal domain-containing protein [Luteolibacter yonseiensis]
MIHRSFAGIAPILRLSLFLICPATLQAASDVTISSVATIGGSFTGSNPKIFTPASATSNVQVSSIQSELNAGVGITINTASGFSSPGDLILSSNLSKSGGASSPLIFTASRDISLTSTISATGGPLPLVLNAGRNISGNQNIGTNGGNVTLGPAGEYSTSGSINAGAGTILLQTGTLRSSSSVTLTSSAGIVIAAPASLRIQGTIAGNLDVAGTISAAAPGTAGALQVNGALTLQPSATTVVDVTGTGANCDKITATGAVNIAGNLQLELTSSFHETIAGTSVFTILQGGSISGTFTGHGNGSRYVLANDRGSFRVNYTATSVTLDDWQPAVVTLAWDPGTAEAGTAIFSNTNTRAGRHYFKVTTQASDTGGWRTRLKVTSGEAALYLIKGSLATTSATLHSAQAGSDGIVLRDDQFAANEEWSLLVFAEEGAQWSIVSGKPYVQDLGPLPFSDTNANGQYDIGETVSPQSFPATPMPPEGIRFFKSSVPVGTPAWSLWMGGSSREIALRSNKLPFHNASSNHTRKQSSQMLLVPPVLSPGSWFGSVVAPMGEMIGLESSIQAVGDLPYNGTVNNVSVTGAPYRVYRVQVPVNQIAWDINATPITGNPNIAVRKGNVPAEFDNEAFSAAPGNATEGITLVPNYLTDGTWYITVWGDAPYGFNLKNGDPVITPLSFTDTKVNDQPARAGWRFYALTDIPSQVGALGWELQLGNQVAGTQIALRRNKVPSRWQKRDAGSTTVTDTETTYTDDSSTNGFLQRVNHQADVWYVGVFTPQQPLGSFTLDVHPIAPPVISPQSATAVNNIEALKWRYFRMDIPAGTQGWDLRLVGTSGGNCSLVVRRDLLPFNLGTNNGGSSGWTPSGETTWPTGYQWAGGSDWTGRLYDSPTTPRRDMNDRIIAAAGRPLVAGTYYIGIYNDGSDPITGLSRQTASLTLESRRIGNGGTIPITDLPFTAGTTAAISNLAPREAAYYRITIPPNTPSWEFTLSQAIGESLLVVRRDAVPDLTAAYNGNVQETAAGYSYQVKQQRPGGERYLLLPENNQNFIKAGDYYLAVVGEGLNPVGTSVIGTGNSSATFTNLGPLSLQDLGTANAAGVVQPLGLVGAQVKAYQFTVPVGTASLEVRLDNRSGNPQMALISGSRIPQADSPAYDYGIGGGQSTAPAGSIARVADDDLITVPNPPAGVYTIAVRADDISGSYPDAAADLVVVANAPVPLTFNGGVATVANQAATAWRYFQVTVPEGIMGWDIRVTNITSGNPQMVIRRDQLPFNTSTNNGGSSGWSPSSETIWPSGYQWAAGVDWTGRSYDSPTNPRRSVGDRLVAAANRPLVPGTYIVGIYNQGLDPITNIANTPASYGIESRGIGAGQGITISEMPFTPNSTVTVANLPAREAAYYKVTIPPNTPRWDFTLASTAGETMLAMRRTAIPDFATSSSGNIQDALNGREMELQRTGLERYSVFPENNQDFIVAGDYYFAVISEGNNPSSGVVGTGTSGAVFTNLGSPQPVDLGTVTTTGIQQAVALAGAQVKTYRFTVPAGTASMEVRMDNRTGNPLMAFMSGTRPPQPDSSAYLYGTGGGQTSTLPGGLARETGTSLVNVVSPPAGIYTLTVRAMETSGTWPDAIADLVITARRPEDLPDGGGSFPVTNQAATAWKYFKVTIPPGIAGWDLRLKDITGGDPTLVVRRDQLPVNTGTNNGGSSGWTPSSTSVWPTGYQWAAGKDWTGRSYDSPSGSRRIANKRLVAAMGRPLEAGTYYIAVYNGGSDPVTGLAGQPCSYTLESRFIGDGRAIPVGTLGFTSGSSANVNNLAPREAAYYKVTVPENTPSWEFTLAPTTGEMMLAARQGFIPDFSVSTTGDLQDEYNREVKVQKAGSERYLLLPPNNQSSVIAGDYYIAAVSEGVNPPSDVIGTATSSGILTSHGPTPVTNLGSASLTPINQAVSLAGSQVKAYQFTVPEGVVSLELQLNNRTGNPQMALISGNRLPFPDSSSNEFGTGGGQSSTPAGGIARVAAASLITIPNPPAGTYSLTIRADDLSSAYPDATGDLVIVAKPRGVLNFAASLNGNGLSHTDTRQLADGQKQFYEVQVPSSLSGQEVLGWLVKVNHAQGDTSLRIYKQWGSPANGVSIGGNTGLIVPPFLTFNQTWFIEVTATGLTQYTITSQPVTIERPAWQMPAGHNFTFGDSGNDASGNPLPGDRGVDIAQDDWHVYAMDVPAGNSGLLRTELKAISGNPDLYIREDGVPTTDHDSNGGESGGDSLVHRKMEDSGSEYGNWVPISGKTEQRLKSGRWYLGVKAKGGSNARYRLMVSTGQVTDLDLSNAGINNQTLIGRDWRYYRFTVPIDAPATWNLGFTQQVGDVVMWIRDTIPPGQNSSSTNASTSIQSWSSDAKNQGPYESAGQDSAGVYQFNTPPLRPGHTYYAGFRANTDATFGLSSSTTGAAPVATPVAFYGGVIDISIPAGGSVFYKISAPAEATRLKWTSTHASTVQIRVEQGTLPAATGNQHSVSSVANSSLNRALTTTDWPWQPGQTYYLRIVNSGTSSTPVLVNISGQNSGTEDEDNDGLLDSWEMTFFNSLKWTAANDPDLDGVTNAVEHADGTNPNDITSAKYFLTVNANFGSVSRSPDLPKYDRGTVVTLTPSPNPGLIFTGWTGSVTGTTDPLVLTMIANGSLTANFGTSLPVALDTGLSFTTGGDGIWTGQVVTTRDGTDAAQSAPITHSQESWMQATVSGPGTLQFWWKVSSSSSDYLEFYIDGVLQSGRISGNVDWVSKSYNITSGTRVLRWRYVKDSSGSNGSDAAWVDQLTWTAAGGYNAWLAGYFNPQEIGNPLIAAPSADPDRDGLSNLVEYAFGGNPEANDLTLGNIVPDTVKVSGMDRLRLRFTLPENPPADVTYWIEVSSDAINWSEVAKRTPSVDWSGNATVTTGAPASGRRPITIIDAGTSPSSRKLGRLKVTLQ